jgi:MFS transporter, CP family, cyanate transporter
VHRFSSKVGIERAIFISLLILAGGVFLRSYVGMTGLWLGTFIIGSAIAVGNVLVPTLIQRDYKNNISFATGIYSVCISLTASIAALISVPLSHLSNWRDALAYWGLPVLIVAALWLIRIIPKPEASSAVTIEDVTETNVWSSKKSWLLTGMMATQSTFFYTLASWIPTLEIARGVSPTIAGLHLFMYQAFSILSGFIAPLLMRNPYSKLPATIGASIPMIIGATGLLFAPNLSVIWIAICGVGPGMSLPVVLSLISLRAGSGFIVVY